MQGSKTLFTKPPLPVTFMHSTLKLKSQQKYENICTKTTLCEAAAARDTKSDRFSFEPFQQLKPFGSNGQWLWLWLSSNVTRFGEISPLWLNFKSLGQIFLGLFSIWQNFDHTVAKMFYYLACFHCCRWPNTLK